MRNLILHELKNHAPFTMLGACSGIVLMLVFYNMPYRTAYNVFYILHPIHLILGALVTTSMYRNYKCAANRRDCNLFALLAIGYVGALGIATLSDSIIPYFGERLLGLPNAEPHIGFLEEWQIVVPITGVGIAIAYLRPTTKLPHAGHILISTWASLFHVIMAGGWSLNAVYFVSIFLFLFIAVWLPCCFSDIVFPMFFIGKGAKDEWREF